MAKESSDRFAYGKGLGFFWGDGQFGGTAAAPLADGREGGDDSMLGGATSQGQTVSGDWIEINGGTTSPFIGGNDYFQLRSTDSYGVGDSVRVYANAIGGNDRMAVYAVGGLSIVVGDFGFADTDATGPLTGPFTLSGGNDLLVGANGNQSEILVGDVGEVAGLYTVIGGNDVIRGREGPNQVHGDFDLITSQSTMVGGNDTLTSGTANDTVTGDGRLALIGTITGGNDRMDAGLGNDIVVGDLKNGATLTASNVTVDLTGGKDTLSGGEGNDTLSGDFASGTLRNFVGGDDLFFGNAGDDRLFGDARYLRLDPTAGQAIGGNDVINGNGDNDYIVGDVGTLLNGSFKGGNDQLFGGLGNDTLIGDGAVVAKGATLVGGDDFLSGGQGNDLINGGGGSDTAGFGTDAFSVTVDLATGVASGQGNDTLISIENVQGSSLSDTLFGNALANTLQGGDGNDTIAGRDGNDVVLGENGNDSLSGDGGQDYLWGGDGVDVLFGGAGADTLNGGTGADLFVLAASSGQDSVEDFADGIDRIDVSGLGLSVSELATRLTIAQFGSSALVTLDAGLNSEASLELLNTQASLVTFDQDFLV